MNHYYDILIIGGGASGVLAALGARKAGFRGSIAIAEKESQPLRKVLASGNGRCNIANLAPVEGHYRSDQPAFILPVFKRYPALKIMGILQEFGLVTIEEREQRIYPRSFQAKSVALLLLNALRTNQVSLLYPLRAQAIEKQADTFLVTTADRKKFTARAVIVAAGSCASPDLGGSRAGYELLHSLGHRLNEPVPSLVPLTLSPHALNRFAEGVRFRGSASFSGPSGVTARAEGEFLVTKYGLSGIAAMELGGAVGHAMASAFPGGSITIDFLPELKEEEVADILNATHVANDDWRIAMAGLVPDKIARALVKCLAEGVQVCPGRGTTAKGLARRLKHLEIDVTGTRGFQFAQVASGGIATKGFDPVTMMSKNIDGLFACGEVLDVDGNTGGFNLLWAMASGYLAGESAALRPGIQAS